MRRPLLYLGDDSLSAAPTWSPIPPSFLCPNMSVSSLSKLMPSCDVGRAPSDTSTTAYRLGFLLRSWVSSSASCSMSTGCSGMTQRSAAPARQVAGPHARRMKKGAAGTAGAVDDRFRERLHVFAVVGLGVAHVVHQPPPAAPDAHHLVAVAQRPNRDRPDGGIETGNVSA